jgi:hypothetical protein
MNKSWPVFLIAVSLIMAGTAAFAANDGVSKMESLMAAPAGMADPAPADDGTIRLTPDKTQIVHLQQDAASVIVTNPAHASVLLDSPRLLVVMPRVPGTTSFTVLNDKGQTITEKTVIVTALAKPKYVRIRRMCDQAGSGACTPTAYFYCPDGCYEVMTVPPDAGTMNVPEIPASRAAVSVESDQPPPAPAAEGGQPAPANQPTNSQQAPAK